jgi:hypothetical protein
MDAPDPAAGIAAEAAAGPPQLTYEDIAGMIEHAVLAPEATEEDVRAACDLARSYRVAAIVVRPYDADVAVRWMAGSGVAVGSVVSYPNGNRDHAGEVVRGARPASARSERDRRGGGRVENDRARIHPSRNGDAADRDVVPGVGRDLKSRSIPSCWLRI